MTSIWKWESCCDTKLFLLKFKVFDNPLVTISEKYWHDAKCHNSKMITDFKRWKDDDYKHVHGLIDDIYHVNVLNSMYATVTNDCQNCQTFKKNNYRGKYTTNL